MNEQDLMLREKIEKREKFDIILAYILLVIISGAIIFVLYMKFIKREEISTPEEYIPNYISLNDISSSLKTSTLANRYLNEGVNFNSETTGDNILVTYVKDDTNVNLNIPLTRGELEINIEEEYEEITTEIYKEITNIICTFYGNTEEDCRSTIENINKENSVDGVRFDSNENKVYITTTKSIELNREIVYSEVTKTSINNTDYTLNLLETEINNITVNTSDTEISFTGNIKRLNDNKDNLSVVVRLYDNQNNLLGENKEEYNDENVLESEDTFEIKFMLSDALKLENITDYSIEVSK